MRYILAANFERFRRPKLCFRDLIGADFVLVGGYELFQ